MHLYAFSRNFIKTIVQTNPGSVMKLFVLYSNFLLQEVGFKDDNVLYIALCSNHLMRGERDAPGQVLNMCKLFNSICRGREGWRGLRFKD